MWLQEQRTIDVVAEVMCFVGPFQWNAVWALAHGLFIVIEGDSMLIIEI